jgi:AcrR family transcriptional regulator
MREDTRSRIQEIALRLFTEHGYEATSLREIAEELGVTKAALYYHFKTKEDIVTSLADQRVAEVEDMLHWLREQPRTSETRRGLLIRYSEQMRWSRHQEIMRFLERNQTALRGHPAMVRMREAMIELTSEMSEPHEELAVRVRRSMAVFTLHAGMWLSQHYEATEEECREAVLQAALDMIDAPAAKPPGEDS